ncbi:hypothetical protein SAMN05216332_10857 [Nitrosospira briensis]|nr:hypothetical protein SAMN05216332_10857 [Nitrosospira briensis]
MVAVRVMQVAIVQVVNMVAVHNTYMPAFSAMRMGMIFVLWQDTISHLPLSFNKNMD